MIGLKKTRASSLIWISISTPGQPRHTVCASHTTILHARKRKRLSALLVCGFLSKLGEPYGGEKIQASAGNRPVKHITEVRLIKKKTWHVISSVWTLLLITFLFCFQCYTLLMKADLLEEKKDVGKYRLAERLLNMFLFCPFSPLKKSSYLILTMWWVQVAVL